MDDRTRRALAFLLIAKIGLTLALWCGPLLFFPAAWLRWSGLPVAEPLPFLRLLGMAYAALIVGYALGLRQVRQGVFPAATVWMGLASNGGAFVILALAAATGAWSSWPGLAPGLMWASLAATGLISAGLATFAARSLHPGPRVVN